MTRVLRGLILAEVAAVLVLMVVQVATASSLPPEVTSWAKNRAMAVTFSWLGLIYIAYFIVVVVAWIGLWRLWYPAAHLYLSAVILSLVLRAAGGPYAVSGPAQAADATAVTIAGAILGVIYFSDLRSTFRSKSPSNRAAFVDTPAEKHDAV